jgi:hypothetical protein
MIGSAWADRWWRMNDHGCSVERPKRIKRGRVSSLNELLVHRYDADVNERWVCRMAQKDSSAAVKLSVNTTREVQIGSTICVNGGDGTKTCPVIGKATHFGRTNESLGRVDMAVMGQLTGPMIIHQSGG